MSHFDVARLEAEQEEFEQQTAEPDFWNDVEKAQAIIGELQSRKSVVDEYRMAETMIEEAIVMVELVEEEGCYEYMDEIRTRLQKIEKHMEKITLQVLLSGEYDRNSAIIAIHAGAGGLEAQDWAEMLYRMYTRWAGDEGFKVEEIDRNSDTEGGLKSVTFSVDGAYSYGNLRSEKGVHRLVRISPFDTSGRRHTSFASVDVLPKLDDIEEVAIDQKDLKIDTYRSSGAGGQHVNTTDSAVRIQHIPTGIIVQSQNERSQHLNRDTAMKLLAAKLIQIREEEHKERIEDIQGSYSQIAWGSQIRSYVFHPYSMVKDHRTNWETGNVQSFMDGNIDECIGAWLKWHAAGEE